MPNFAHAGVVTVAAYAIYAMNQQAGWPFWVAVICAILIASTVSALTDVFAYRFVRSQPLAAPAVALGLRLILDSSMLQLFGERSKSISPPYAQSVVHLGDRITLSGVNLAVIVAVLVAIAALSVLLARTSIGRTIRAVSQDREAADPGHPAAAPVHCGLLHLRCTGRSCGPGVCADQRGQPVHGRPGHPQRVRVVLGGLGRVWGAIVGGIALGIVESIGATYISASYYQTVFGALLLVLVLKPSGLLTTTVGRKALPRNPSRRPARRSRRRRTPRAPASSRSHRTPARR